MAQFQKIFPLGPVKAEVIVADIPDTSTTNLTVKSLMNNPRIASAMMHMPNSTTSPSTGASVSSISGRDITVNFGAQNPVSKITIFVIGE